MKKEFSSVNLRQLIDAATAACEQTKVSLTLEAVREAEKRVVELLSMLEDLREQAQDHPRAWQSLKTAHAGWSQHWKSLVGIKERLEARAIDEGPLDACKRFVLENWVPLAGVAWRHYQKCGKKGAILIPYNVIQNPHSFEARYITFTKIDRLDIEIATYDPTRSVIAVFAEAGEEIGPEALILKGGTSWAYVVTTHEPRPPEASTLTSH